MLLNTSTPLATSILPRKLYGCPFLGYYTVVQLNVLKALGEFGDDQALTEAQAVDPQKYVVYVRHIFNALDWESPECTFEGIWLSPRPPRKSVRGGVEEDMCVAVGAQPEFQTSPNREPLVVNKPLPWGVCYHHTVESIVILRGSNDYKVPEVPAELDVTEELRLNDFMSSDEQRHEALLGHHSPSQSSRDPRSVYSDDQEEETRTESHTSFYDSLIDGSEGDSASETSEDDDDLVNGAHAEMQEAADIFGKILSEPTPEDSGFVDVSYDYESITTLADPRRFHREFRQVERIVKAARIRAMQRIAEQDQIQFGRMLEPKQPNAEIRSMVSRTPKPIIARMFEDMRDSPLGRIFRVLRKGMIHTAKALRLDRIVSIASKTTRKILKPLMRTFRRVKIE